MSRPARGGRPVRLAGPGRSLAAALGEDPRRAEPDVYVGLMSGTSLDGITAAAVRFAIDSDGYPSACQLLAHLTRPYEVAERNRLERALRDGASTAEWCQLGFDVGAWLTDAARALLAAGQIPRRTVRAIGSHGQTVWHAPGRSTWQIGEAAVIAERMGVDVVSDFRVADVAAGGQGAPLVPVADALLFAPDRGARALQNVGGIANVTIVHGRGAPAVAPIGALSGRPGAAPHGRLAATRGFDTGPGVVVIDAVVRRLRPDLPYDIDGALARQGRPLGPVVDALLADPYFAAPPPKSTGREHFSAAYVTDLIARCQRAGASGDADIVATAVALTARSIADAYARFIPEPVDDVLLSGGGARNPALRDAIARALAPRVVRVFDAAYFDGEAKEAVAFALLAALHVAGLPSNVPGATGALGPRVLGKLSVGRVR